jgi:hypothetical protein
MTTDTSCREQTMDQLESQKKERKILLLTLGILFDEIGIDEVDCPSYFFIQRKNLQQQFA